MTIDIYLDCADLDGIRAGKQNPLVRGVTTNPSLMHKAGITNYERFAKDALQIVEGLPISFEVFSDDFSEMEIQARKIASWGENVNVKIPVTNTKGESAAPLVRKLSDSGILCNVTAVFIQEQIDTILREVNRNDPIIISIFCGRIADTSREPKRLFGFYGNNKVRHLWASTRAVIDITYAEQSNFGIITVTPDLLAKYEKFKGMDLTEFSLSTVKMFYEDAKKAGFQL